MNFNKIKIIIGREFNTRVKKKSFILMTVLTPLLFAGFMVVYMYILMANYAPTGQNVLVVDNSGVVAIQLESDDNINYIVDESGRDIETLKKEMEAENWYAIMEISELDKSNNVSVSTYSKKQLNIDLKDKISKTVKTIIEGYKLTTYDIDNLEQILKDIRTNIPIKTYTLSETGEAKESSSEMPMFAAMLLGLLIYMFVFMFGNMVMRGVIEEKSTRIVEVIVSSVKPVELMMGKILGVAAVALTQFAIWIILTWGLATLGMSFMDKEVLMDMAGTEQVAAATGMNVEEMAAMANGQTTTSSVDASAGNVEANAGEAAATTVKVDNVVSKALSQFNLPYIIGMFLVFFVFGYLLYAAMFAAIGSAVDNEADTQQLILPVTMPLILGLLMMMSTMRNPDSALAFWGSIIPFTSPMVMVARLPFGVPAWEMILSVVLLVGTFVLFTYFAGKIYRTGILMYGKKVDFKELWKWIKIKN